MPIYYGSTYEIISVTKTDSEQPQLVCSVYYRDRKKGYGTPVMFATVSLRSVKGRTDIEGRTEFEIPTGTHLISVDADGDFEAITTVGIDFEPYTRTEIRFDLGKETMGLPIDYLEGKKQKIGAYY